MPPAAPSLQDRFHIDAARYRGADDFATYQGRVQKNGDLWNGVHRTTIVPEDVRSRGTRLTMPWRLLVLAEDWCGDAANAVPVVSRLADALGLELRVLGRDATPDVMAAHLTSQTRSIPVVMALNGDGVEWGWWGPRPAVVQRWVRSVGLLLPKDERYRRTRAWYARDRGRTIMEEVLEMLERAERRRAESGDMSASATGSGLSTFDANRG